MEFASVPSEHRETRLKEWISRYSDDVLRTCFVLLSDRTLAEDATQDTFLKAWKTSRQFAKQVQDLLTILALREEGELSKRDCYLFDLNSLLQAENLRQAQGKEVNQQAITETYQSLTIHDKKEIQINGGILIKEYGYQPGPDLGEILTEIEFAIVDGELENDRQAIHAYLREKK